MTRRLFSTLEVCHDQTARSAAINMAIDEALLGFATEPLIRFYRLRSPALSFGYFGRFADVATYQGKRDLVRRWTGGGIVLHGEDLTYSIVIPVGNPVFCESSTSIYEKIHRALCDVLAETGQSVVLAEGDSGSATLSAQTHTSDADYNCFAKPVRTDLMIDGRKIAGAAQRRTRRGLLQQGSIQGIKLGNNLTEQFAQTLSANCRGEELGEEIVKHARDLARQKYGTENWLLKR